MLWGCVGTEDTAPSQEYDRGQGCANRQEKLPGLLLILPALRSLGSGRPVPLPTHLRWLQNGRPAEELSGVQVASQGTTLHIDHVEPGHAGLFSCQATNEAGTAGAEVELSVHGEGLGQPDRPGWVEPEGLVHLRLWQA